MRIRRKISVDWRWVDDEIHPGESTEEKISAAANAENNFAMDMETLKTDAYIVHGQYSGEKLVQPEAGLQIDRINGITQGGPGAAPRSNISPTQVRVTVRNGVGSAGLATRVASALDQDGFEIAFTGDADNFRHTRTIIRYAPTSLAKAQLLQSYFIGGADLVADTTLRTVDVSVTVGSNYTGVRSAPAGGANAPTATTGGPATTTTSSTVPAIPGVAKGAPATPAC